MAAEIPEMLPLVGHPGGDILATWHAEALLLAIPIARS